MSSGERILAGKAMEIAEEVRLHLEPFSERFVVAGSLRRDKATVGDVEIVVLPKNLSGLLRHLDALVEANVCKKALYDDGKTRWGSLYRGLSVRGVRVEIFIANPNNFGYILWLRTGPANLNEYVMRRLSMVRYPVRFREGQALWVEYPIPSPTLPASQGGGFKDFDVKAVLNVPDERVLFQLLGMPVIPPELRKGDAYATYMERGKWWINEAILSEHVLKFIPNQTLMF